VSLHTNNLTSRAITEMCEALSQCKSLTHLYLGSNMIVDESVASFAKLIRNAPLIKLSLCKNYISDNGMLDLASAIKDSNTLQCLDIHETRSLTRVGARHLYVAIKCHRTMQEINLHYSEWVTQSVKDQIRQRLQHLHSQKAKALTVMMAARMISRLKDKSLLRTLDIDLFRRLGEML
jgi:Ran GTPase-activating protein (RanGAP) involved in mRNA processing and transport